MDRHPELPPFEKETQEKPIRKATTLYLNESNYRFVKNNLKGKTISIFIDEVLDLVAKDMKLKLQRIKEKGDDKSSEDDKNGRES